MVIVEKIIQMFYHQSFAIRNEISRYSESINDSYVEFKNGSKISAETSNDNSRGLRCHILIADEFRMIDKDVIDKVLIPMLNVYRQPPFRNKPEYKDYPQEENKQIYMSSAWYQSHWSWLQFKSFFNEMMKTSQNMYSFVCSLPYQLSIKHGLLSKESVEKEKAKETFDQAGFDMEYEALFLGENDRGYFQLQDINKCRTITKTFVPPTNLEYIENRSKSKPDKLGNMPRKSGEIRLVNLDIALMGGNKSVKNDSSAFTLFRLILDGNKYKRQVVYIETINKTIADDDLAVRLKQLYNDFEADYAIIDTNGVGLGVYNACTALLYDEERDVEYEAWSCINDEEMNKARKTVGKPVIYSVKASAQFNHEIATLLKNAFEKGRIAIPITDIEKRQELVTSGEILKLSDEEYNRQMYTYYQSTALGNELISLEYSIGNGSKIKIQEVGSATKDRYSSLAYGNYYANELEKQLIKEEESDFGDFLFF